MKKNENLKKEKYCFFCPRLEFKHFLFLFFFLVSLIKKTVQTFFEKNQKLAVDFLKLYLYDIGDFLSIIPYIIMKYRTKSKKTKLHINNNKMNINSVSIVNDNIGNDSTGNDGIGNNINNNIELIYNEQDNNKNICGKIVKIFIFTIVDFIAQISENIYYVIKEDENLDVKLVNLNSSLIVSIIAIIIFSKIMLHDSFYRHHCFSFSIIILCFLALSAVDIIQICNDDSKNKLFAFIYLVIKIVKVLLYSLEHVLAKVIFLYYFISPYTLLLFKSIIHFFYLVIFSIPFIFIKIKEKGGEGKTIFSKMEILFDDKKFIFIVVGYTINSFFYNILDLQIINVFSPNHFVIAKVFENFGIFIINLLINGESENYSFIIKSVMYALLIFASLIFNEYLVINICGLAKNTKIFLAYEAEKEKNDKLSDENSVSSNSNNVSLIAESEIY